MVAEIESWYGEPGVDRAIKSVQPRAILEGDDFGIMVSRKIIELYGGKVECQRQAAGSKFTISFNT